MTRVRATCVETAMLNAASEEGVFSVSFQREAAAIYLNEQDMVVIGVRDGDAVHCQVPERTTAVVLVAKASGTTPPGTARIARSALVTWFLDGCEQDIECTKTSRSPTTLHDEFNKLLAGASQGRN